MMALQFLCALVAVVSANASGHQLPVAAVGHHTDAVSHNAHVVGDHVSVQSLSTPVASHHAPVVNNHAPAVSHHAPVVSHHTPVVSHHVPVVSHHTPVVSHHAPVVSHHAPIVSHHAPVVSHHAPVVSHHTPVVSHHAPVVSHHAPIVSHHAPAITHSSALPHVNSYSQVDPSTTSQYHAQGELGQYSFGYDAGNSGREETRDAYGNVRGSYSYVDSYGNLQTQHYVADEYGFRVIGTDLPIHDASATVHRYKRSSGKFPASTGPLTAMAHVGHVVPVVHTGPALPYSGLHGHGRPLSGFSYGYHTEPTLATFRSHAHPLLLSYGNY